MILLKEFNNECTRRQHVEKRFIETIVTHGDNQRGIEALVHTRHENDRQNTVHTVDTLREGKYSQLSRCHWLCVMCVSIVGVEKRWRLLLANRLLFLLLLLVSGAAVDCRCTVVDILTDLSLEWAISMSITFPQT